MFSIRGLVFDSEKAEFSEGEILVDGGKIVPEGKPDRVLDAIRVVTAHHCAERRVFRIVPDYDVDNVSKKVVRIIHSYVDYVNRVIWGKD